MKTESKQQTGLTKERKIAWVIRVDDPEMDSGAYLHLNTGFELLPLKKATLFDRYIEVTDQKKKLLAWDENWDINAFRVFYRFDKDGSFLILTSEEEINKRYAKLEKYDEEEKS